MNKYLNFLETNNFPGFKRADIIAIFSNRSMLSKLIRWGEQIGNEEKSIISHVELYLFSGMTISQDIHCRLKNIKRHFTNNKHIWLIHDLSLPLSSRNTIIAEAMKDVANNKPYDYLQLFGFLLYKLTGKLYLKDKWQMKDKDVCSSAIAKWYRTVGVEFNHGTIVSPDDIWDFVQNNPNRFRIIKIWGNSINYKEKIKELLNYEKTIDYPWELIN